MHSGDDLHTDGPPQGGEWLRAEMLENSFEIVKLVDLDGKLRYASPAYTRVLGYEVEEVLGRNVLDLVHPEDLGAVVEATERAAEQKGSATNIAEYRLRHKDGSWRWMESVGTYLLDDPAVRGVVINSRDVTERKRAHERLTESERRFAFVVSNARAFAYRCSSKPGYPCEFVSDYVLELTGYSPEDLLAGRLAFGDLIVPEDRERVREEVRNALANGAGFEVRYEIRRREGGTRHVWEHGRAVRESGRVAAFEGLVFDVTNLAETERRLRRSEAMLAESQRIARIGSWDLDLATDALVWSDEMYRLFEVEPEGFVGTSEAFWERIHPDDRRRVEEVLEKATASPQPFAYDYRLRLADGRERHMRSRGYVVVGSDTGEPAHMFGTAQDITEHTETIRALRGSEARHRDRSRELTLLHRVRTALAREPGAQGVLREVVEAIARAYGYALVSAYLREGDELVLQHQVGYHRVIERIPVATGVSGRAVRAGEPLLVEDVRSDPEFLGAIEGITSEICVPLFDEVGAVTGFFNVESVEGVALTREDLRLMTDVGEHVSVALGRARLHARVRDREERFRVLIQNATDIVTLLDAEGTIRYQSPSIAAILGYDGEQMLGRDAFDFIHPEDRARTKEVFRGGVEDPESRPSVEYRFRHADGSWRWLESRGTNLLDDPSLGEYVVNSRDVTERKEAERALAESEQRFRLSFRDAAVGMALEAPDGRFLQVNRSLCEITGYTEAELLERSFGDLTHPADLEGNLERTRRLLDGEISTFGLEKRYIHRRGHEIRVLVSVSLVRDEAGTPLYFVSQVQDITARKEMEEQLQHRALHDPLTGLPNRELFADRLGQALERTRRRRGYDAAVLFADLDGFKTVNDSLGHRAGDALLKAVTRRLRACLRPEDTLARFGGDEFIALVEGVEVPDDAVRVARRITDEMRRPFFVDDRELFVTASVGIAIGDSETGSPEDLVRNADTAMYGAKDSATGYRLFDPTMHERAVGRLKTRNDLRRAIDRGEFVVHYQPLVSLASGALWGLEALVRWDHPERGLLDPLEFVSAAEESGLAVPFGRQVLAEACRRTADWQRAYPRTPPLTVSVNLSARQVFRFELAEEIEGVLAETGLDGRSLLLDVAETPYVEAVEDNGEVLERLGEKGVRISLDDFGTGYSSLSYLKRGPAYALKIDRSFVRGLGRDPADTAIVRMIIELAHALGMEVIAEGIEEEGQVSLLREMGCDHGQGYFFSRPLPADEVPRLLEAARDL